MEHRHARTFLWKKWLGTSAQLKTAIPTCRLVERGRGPLTGTALCVAVPQPPSPGSGPAGNRVDISARPTAVCRRLRREHIGPHGATWRIKMRGPLRAGLPPCRQHCCQIEGCWIMKDRGRVYGLALRHETRLCRSHRKMVSSVAGRTSNNRQPVSANEARTDCSSPMETDSGTRFSPFQIPTSATAQEVFSPKPLNSSRSRDFVHIVIRSRQPNGIGRSLTQHFHGAFHYVEVGSMLLRVESEINVCRMEIPEMDKIIEIVRIADIEPWIAPIRATE